MDDKTPITLYGLAASTCTQRVIATLTEKGLSFKLISVDFAGGEHKVRAKTKVNHRMNFFKYLDSKVFGRKTAIWCYSGIN